MRCIYRFSYIIILSILSNFTIVYPAQDVHDTDYINICRLYKNINTVYAEIKLNGIDEENNRVAMNCLYWYRRPGSLKKILFAGNDTVVTIVNDSTVIIYYPESKTVLTTDIKDINENEKELFLQQNFIFEYYNPEKLTELFSFTRKEVSEKKIKYFFKKKDTELVFEFNRSTYYPEKISIRYLNGNDESNMDMIFKKLEINCAINEEIFQFKKNRVYNNYNAAEFK